MNNQLQEFARQQLKGDLPKCTEGQQLLFKRMYSYKNQEATIEEVVDKMKVDKLDWAMQQVQSTLIKNKRKT